MSFEDWVLYLIEDPYEVDWEIDPTNTVEQMGQLFRSSGKLIQTYTADALNTMFWCLLGELGPPNLLFREDIPLQARINCITAIEHVFTDLFAKNCTEKLSYLLKDPDPEMSPLNSICYMWWDLFPSWGAPDQPHLQKIDEAILEVMAKTLQIPHIACQESAIHGLGHWHLNCASKTEPIIDQFLATATNSPTDLLNYAKYARQGCVN